MNTLHAHPHAAFDRYPQLVRDLIEEFGEHGIDAVVDRFIVAESADFHWGGRLAEMNHSVFEGLDDTEEAFEQVAILGYFRGRYYTAICLVDRERRAETIFRLHHFECFESAEAAFLASGG